MEKCRIRPRTWYKWIVRRCLVILTAVLFLTLGGGIAIAGEPPDQKDPCSSNGRNKCGTSGVGEYRSYKFGPRWFGDYRGAVKGVRDALFCVDLRYWYPGKRFGYRQRPAKNLRNREGDRISATALRRMNYAIWRYGRTDNVASQGAAMLYVHSLMKDGAPGEVTATALSAPSRAIYREMMRDVPRFAGPYRVQVTMPKNLLAGQQAEATIQVLSGRNRPVPNVSLKVTGSGFPESLGKVDTGDSGIATVKFTPLDPGKGVDLTATADSLPTAEPALYVPSKRAPARSGQRLAGPQTEPAKGSASAPVRVAPQVQTQISSQSVTPGSTVTDLVKVTGLLGETVTVKAALYGPYPARDKMTCGDQPVWSGSFVAKGDGEYVTDPVKLDTPGYYTYVEWIDEAPSVVATKTKCGEASETTIVRGQPTIKTQISEQQSKPGSTITDLAIVSGLGKLSAKVKVELWGPYPTKDAMNCQGTPAWTGEFVANGDGNYTTAPYTLTSAGYYTYREMVERSDEFDAVSTACGEVSETTISKAEPTVETIVSDTVVRPGAKLHDRVKVSGVGKTAVKVQLELYGPYESLAAIKCRDKPFWTGTVDAAGDGEFNSEPVEIKRAGFYTYREQIVATETVSGTRSECAVSAETSLGRPLILTGGGDRVAEVRVAQDEEGPNPTRVRVPSLGINAKVMPMGIDLQAGAVGAPKDISRVGWWRDGAAPGARIGTVLLAGHVDSKKRGAGAFYSLKSARRGAAIELRSDDGRNRRYRVTTVKKIRKELLPNNVYSRTGPRRLVLVTCGGPFNTETGHYRDNIIVTAVPR